MPTYEYVCEKCGHHFDRIQSIAAPSLTTCSKDDCGQKKWGKGKLHRAITGGAGLIFKGRGFYITDYRSDKYKEAAKKDIAPSTASKETKTTESKSSESKPAAAKPAKTTEK